jgi:hypothetical protein
VGSTVRSVGRSGLLGAAVLGALLSAGCTSSPAAPASSPTAGSSAASSSGATTSGTPAPTPDANTLVLDITIAAGKVSPNGQKITAKVGQQVVLHVTSDQDDEIHAHTGGDGYELEVPAGKPTTGSFTLTSPGSFEVESHHLGKTIVILNAS